MNGMVLLLLVIGTAAGFSGCESESQDDPSATPAWENKSLGWIHVPPAAYGGRIIVIHPDSDDPSVPLLSSIDSRSGRVKWSTILERGEYCAPAMLEDGSIIVAKSTLLGASLLPRVQRFSADGKEMWSSWEGHIVDESEANAIRSHSPVIDAEGNVYLAIAHELLSWNADGKLRWRQPVQGWELPRTGFDYSVAVAGDRLFLAAPAVDQEGGTLQCLSRQDGRLLWIRDLPSWPIWCGPAVAPNGSIVVANHFIASFTAEGQQEWFIDDGPPPVGGNMCPVFGTDGTLYVASGYWPTAVRQGEIVWRTEFPEGDIPETSPSLTSDGHLLSYRDASGGPRIDAVEVSTGAIARSLVLSKQMDMAPAYMDFGRLYISPLLTDDGYLVITMKHALVAFSGLGTANPYTWSSEKGNSRNSRMVPPCPRDVCIPAATP